MRKTTVKTTPKHKTDAVLPSLLDNLSPLHDRILVRRLVLKSQLIQLIQENSNLSDMIGMGENGEHDDNRRVFLMSRVLAVGGSVRGIKKGDTIAHTAWNDLPPWLDAPKDYSMIRENDVAGFCEPAAMGYEA